MSNRGCSLPLPRVIVDFGADHAFDRVSNNLYEHDGITIATSTIRHLTQHHGPQIVKQEKPSDAISDRAGCAIPLKFWKNALKNNEYKTVIDHLKPDLEANEVNDNHAPIRVYHRYLSNHSHQLDYKTAINQGLPIGSGEIESAHRYVIQECFKLSGAWWKANHVDSMLALRVLRANDEWNGYWEQPAKET